MWAAGFGFYTLGVTEVQAGCSLAALLVALLVLPLLPLLPRCSRDAPSI